MYAFLSGIIEEKEIDTLVMNCNGVGYEVFCSGYTLDALPKVGDVGTVYTYLHVREDAMQLFGFASKEEKKLFLALTTVSGVGSKTAIQILSGLKVKDLMNAIYLGDVNAISHIKGIGKKTAERIVLELKNKIDVLPLIDGTNEATISVSLGVETPAVNEAISALVEMGLSRVEATRIVKAVALDTDSAEAIIAKSLRNMG